MMISIPHVTKHFDLRLREVVVSYDGNLSLLQPLPAGLVLLLGKNATGKSSFLNAFRAFDSGEEASFPRLTFRYEVPTEEEHIEYLEVRSNFLGDDQFAALVEKAHSMNFFEDDSLRRLATNLPMTECVIAALSRDFSGHRFIINNEVLDATRTLRVLGIAEAEIAAFQRRQGEFAHLNSRRQDEQEHFDHYTLDIHELFCEWVLLLVDASGWKFEDAPADYPWYQTESAPWIREDVLRSLFLSAMREVFMFGDIEVSSTYDSFREEANLQFAFSLETIPERAADLYLKECRRRLNQEVGHLDEFTYVHKYPYDALFDVKGRCVSSPVKLNGSGVVINDDSTFQGCGAFLKVGAISSRSSFDAIHETVCDMVRWNLEIRAPWEQSENKLTDSQDAIFTVAGAALGLHTIHRRLQRISESLRQLDLGIHEIALRQKTPTRNLPNLLTVSATFGAIGLGIANHGLPTSLPLSYRSHSSGDWMPLKFASDGQLAAINALLSIPVSAHPTAVVQTANLTVLVGDEVDRHLHPTAADKLFSQIHHLAKESGVTVIAATHSIPLLASHDLTECLRLYAFRDALDRFSITTEPTRDMEVLARELGTDILRARSLVRLHIVVEGEVDEVVIEELLADTSISAGDYAFIRLDGLKNLTRDWRAYLRHLSSPILVVYDKQCADFETAWHKIKSSPQSAIHERSELRRLNNELLERKRKKLFRSGDTELEAVLKLSQELLNSKRIADHPRQIKRTNFFGIPEDDIVDCLPMKYFKQKQLPGMEKMPRAETWAEARKMLTGSSFTLKQVYGINVDAVRTALQKMRTADEVLTHPRLGELRAEVQSFLEAHNDPRANS
jgi:hypothetical protein